MPDDPTAPCPRCKAQPLVAEEGSTDQPFYHCGACKRRYHRASSGELIERPGPSSVWGSIVGAFRSFAKSVGGQT